MKKKLTFIALLFLVFANISYANTLEVIDYGIYENKFNGDIIESNNVVAGVVKPSYSMELINKTDIVDAKVGIAFGFRFVTKGNFNTKQVQFCGEHPPMKNPKTGKVATKECFYSMLKTKKIQWHTYVIENSWEIVPGKWKLFIKQNNEVIAEKSFIINAPKQ